MKTIEEKARAYDRAKDIMEKYLKSGNAGVIAENTIKNAFPELHENEDEIVKEELINYLKHRCNSTTLSGEERACNKWIDWLEKQDSNLVKNGYTDNKDVIKYAGNYSRAIWYKLMDNFKNIKDYHIGCNDVSDIVLNAIIDTYNWLEKQGEQKPADREFTFKAIPRLLEMIEPTNRAKTYCQKLIDTLIKEGYVIDAMIVGESLKQMNGEDVPMATMDEQKSINKVKPKFHEGAWITNGNYTWKIVEVKPLDYILQSQDGNIVDDTISHVDEQFHSFTIQDAKDGDVLACESGWTCIFKTLVNDENFSSYCFMDNTKWVCETGSECHTLKEEFVKAYNGKIYPATKEQCDTLMKAMADAGYAFDFENKELKKIEQRPIDECDEYSKMASDVIVSDNDKPKFKVKYANSEYNVLEIKEIAGVTFYGIEDEPNHIDYVKADNCEIINGGYGIKENGFSVPTKPIMFSEQNPAWSEYDMSKVQRICKYLDEAKKYYADITEVRDCINWLKSLKDRVQPQNNIVTDKELAQAKKDAYNDALDKIEYHSGEPTFDDGWNAAIWYLKKRNDRPQSHWTPSDAQIQALKEACDKSWEPDGLDLLYTLYKDLKKLKGE